MIEISKKIFPISGTLSAALISVSYGFSLSLFVVFTAFGLVVDFANSFFAKHASLYKIFFARFNLIIFLFAALLIITYFILDSLCSKLIVDLIEKNFSIVRWRNRSNLDYCEIPHGFSVVVSQALIPIATIILCWLNIFSVKFAFQHDTPPGKTYSILVTSKNLAREVNVVLALMILVSAFQFILKLEPNQPVSRALFVYDSFLYYLLFLYLSLTPAFGFYLWCLGNIALAHKDTQRDEGPHPPH